MRNVTWRRVEEPQRAARCPYCGRNAHQQACVHAVGWLDAAAAQALAAQPGGPLEIQAGPGERSWWAFAQDHAQRKGG